MTDQNSQFFAMLTAVGEAKQANADALGIAWKITQMGVGDANGTEPTPDRLQTALLNERRRAPLNQLKVDPSNASIIIAEQVIPEDVGGWWIREIGLYDEADNLVAIANCAPSFKPQLSQGSGRTQVVRMNLIVSSATNVELKIDPSVVLATRKYVDDELAKLDHKNSVRVATTAAIVLSGTQTIDGIALIAGDRVLVKNQAAGAANGIYVVATGAWSRAVDADASIEVTPGMLVPVEQGTANADSVWQLATDGVIVLGTTALAFEASAGPSGVSAGSYRSVTVDKRGRVTGGTNPTTLAGYGLTDAAPLASPALTGTPTAPTAVQATNNTQLATTAFVKAALAALVDSSPLTLDTLNELAAALGDDPNFAATITTLLGLKAPLASPNFTGDPTAPTPPPLDNDTSLATTAFVKRSGLTYAAIESILGNRLMAAADAGKIFVIGAPATITLPLASSLPQATTITFFYYSAPNVPTFVRSGADLFATGGGALSAYTPKSTGYITFINEAADTWEISGSGALDQLSGFAATLSTAGSQRLPSGLIRKWGLFTVPANVSSAPVDVTFPLAFPNACLNLKAGIGIQISDYDTPVNYRSNRQEISLGLGTTTGFEGQAFIDNNLGHTRIVQWEAIGY